MEIRTILQQYFGHDSFRPLQEEIIQSVLENKDVLAVLPTAGGKSICYQVPALARPGLCLVISPLIALMKDQVANLRSNNITAFAIYSGMSWKEVISTLEVAGNSNCKLLYVSPERLGSRMFLDYLPGLDINLIAVDEAHCIAQWGYDFRPSYLQIANFRAELPDIPVLAVTASATHAVQIDICEKLLGGKALVYRQSFYRPNLSYSVFQVDSKIKKIKEILSKVSGSAIVYCKSRKRTEQIAAALSGVGIGASFYHAGLNPEQRVQRQESWMSSASDALVCTNAFGMGIDKPGVRTVIHADPPDCIENYYQEAGRAGRDQQQAYAVLLYEEDETTRMEALADMRFPLLTKMTQVYHALMNYKQIPTGSGAGISYDFDRSDFQIKFKLDPYLVDATLKALESEGFLAVLEQHFTPSIVCFIISKNLLEGFEKGNPQLVPVMHALLRTYPGIFDGPVGMSERVLAASLRRSVSLVMQDLQSLHSHGVLHYEPSTRRPQLRLLQDRVQGARIPINAANYHKRKKECKARVDQMIQYARMNEHCRSQFIATYFGETEAAKCGICDLCLAEKKRMR